MKQDFEEINYLFDIYPKALKNKKLKILIPGCGNAYEGSYLMEQGFKNTYLIDLSETALKNFKKSVDKMLRSLSQ